jgi:hypothetical protein
MKRKPETRTTTETRAELHKELIPSSICVPTRDIHKREVHSLILVDRSSGRKNGLVIWASDEGRGDEYKGHLETR